MDEQRLKAVVLAALERDLDAKALARALGELGDARDAETTPPAPPAPPAVSAASQKLLGRVVLSDILDDAILAARPQDRTFPLRLLFAELGRLLATDDEDGPGSAVADAAFTFASGLNFFFRARMETEAKMRAGLETSRALYTLAHAATLDPELVTKASPLLAALMTNDLDKLRFEAVDHARVFDSTVHERAPEADPTSSRVLRPMTFLCRVAANNAVKAKAQVLT